MHYRSVMGRLHGVLPLLPHTCDWMRPPMPSISMKPTKPSYICGYSPWAPTQRFVIPVFWGPNGIAIGVAPYKHNPNSLGYGLVYARDMQTTALPYYYKYNLAGAYPYR